MRFEAEDSRRMELQVTRLPSAIHLSATWRETQTSRCLRVSKAFVKASADCSQG